jgi:Putative beta-barrel porin-2, OmpL-like. bbp2
MRRFLWKAMMLAAIAAVTACTGAAQAKPASAPQPALLAASNPPGAATADTTSHSTAATPPAASPLEQEVEVLKARIDQLEKEVEHPATAEGSSDAAQLTAAEKELVSANQLSALKSINPQAAVTPAAAEPAPPEISAQTTTKGEPFPGDWTWLNSNGHAVDSPMSTKYFTPEFRADANYILDYNHPVDDTMGGATESFRSDEWQLEQVSIGGDIRINNVRGRILTMDGLFATTTPRNDASVNRGNWDLAGAYKYVSEAWGGYHWDVAHGLNVDAGIFVSYIGLFSYYNFDNWTYQPSFVSSNTPWFFNGMRIQYFPTSKLKIEPWIINGWQSYARFSNKPGLGGQILWRPKPYLDFVWNNYGMGEDDSGNLGRSRIHADYSAQVKVYDQPTKLLDKIAFTVTGDAGCEYGGGPISFGTADGALNKRGLSPEKGTTSSYNGGVNCHSSKNGEPKEAFIGWMMYNRIWFKHDLYAITLGGGQMNNPGRYLTLLPPINGATAVTGSPYFTENAGDRSQMHDGTITFDYMPSQFITFRIEEGYRYSDVPYWTGHGGITPPGGNNGAPTQYACASGAASGQTYGTAGQTAAETFCQNNGLANGNMGEPGTPAALGALWWPDLRTNQTNTTIAIMVRF